MDYEKSRESRNQLVTLKNGIKFILNSEKPIFFWGGRGGETLKNAFAYMVKLVKPLLLNLVACRGIILPSQPKFLCVPGKFLLSALLKVRK